MLNCNTFYLFLFKFLLVLFCFKHGTIIYINGYSTNYISIYYYMSVLKRLTIFNFDTFYRFLFKFFFCFIVYLDAFTFNAFTKKFRKYIARFWVLVYILPNTLTMFDFYFFTTTCLFLNFNNYLKSSRCILTF